MTIKGAGQIIIKEIDGAIDSLKGCVAPIFGVSEEGESELVGSAVLIEVSGEVFFCTAEHVASKNVCSALYIDGPSDLAILEGEFKKSEKYDLAVLKLKKEQTALLKEYTPLGEKQIAIPPEASRCRYANLVGFPWRKNPNVYGETKIKGQLYSIGGSVKAVGIEKVSVSFSKRKNIDAKTRQRVQAPQPHGMSGGAIFGTEANKNTIEGRPEPKLIGIITDCPPPQAREIFGPSMAIIMMIIRDAYKVSLPERLANSLMRRASSTEN